MRFLIDVMDIFIVCEYFNNIYHSDFYWYCSKIIGYDKWWYTVTKQICIELHGLCATASSDTIECTSIKAAGKDKKIENITCRFSRVRFYIRNKGKVEQNTRSYTVCAHKV